MLSIYNILPAKTLEKNLKPVVKNKVTQNSSIVQKAISKSVAIDKMYGEHNGAQITNILARVLFRAASTRESRIELAKQIISGSNQKPENIIPFLKKQKYKCIEKMTEEDWKNLYIKVPKTACKNPSDWNFCKSLSFQIFNGKINNEKDISIQYIKNQKIDIKEKIKKYTAQEIINALTRTIFMEGKSEGEKGMDAIASVIWNRIDGNKRFIIDIIKQDSQFSCWNKYNWSKFSEKYDPEGDIKQFRYALKLACKIYKGEFESTVGNRNIYYNPETSSPKNLKILNKCANPIMIGKHRFAYSKELEDRLKKTQSKEFKEVSVKSGDTLAKIASKHNLKLDELLKLNPQIKDKNKINVGDLIRVY